MAPRPKTSEREDILQATRSKLLQAAIGEFAREGFSRANINRISTAAGYAKGTIYNHFANKRALMYELLEEIAGSHFGYVAERVGRETSPERRLETFFEAGFEWAEDHLESGRVMLTVLYGADLDFKRHLGECYGPFFQLIREGILVQGIEQGEFQVANVREMVALLMTIYLGTSSQFDDAGRLWLDPKSVSGFVLRALRVPDASDQ